MSTLASIMLSFDFQIRLTFDWKFFSEPKLLHLEFLVDLVVYQVSFLVVLALQVFYINHNIQNDIQCQDLRTFYLGLHQYIYLWNLQSQYYQYLTHFLFPDLHPHSFLEMMLMIMVTEFNRIFEWYYHYCIWIHWPGINFVLN